MFENKLKTKNSTRQNFNSMLMQQQTGEKMMASHQVKGQRNVNIASQCDLRPAVCSRQRMPFVVLALFILASIELVEGALRNVNLIIEPPAVRRGQHAVLRCEYDLEKAPLYSAKFYRGQLEFYRYTPGEFPNTKVFPFPGIHVDVTSSNATQVLIRNVGFGLSGNFSCEVTADAPLFSTATAVGMMQVVELPEKRPTLFTEHTRYEPGDVLRANCSTPPSRPRAELKFFINNMVVTNAETQYIRTIDNLIASRISLKLQLQGVHFSSVNPLNIYSGTGSPGYGQMLNSVHGYGHGHGASGGSGSVSGSGAGGGLVLRCTAQIGELYQEYKEIELGTPQRDPVPARVTLSSGSSMKNFFSSYFSAAPGQHASAASTACMLFSAALLAYSHVAASLAATALFALMAAVNSLRLLFLPHTSSTTSSSVSPSSSPSPSPSTTPSSLASSLSCNNKATETHSVADADADTAAVGRVTAEAPRQRQRRRCRQRRLLSQR